MSASTFHQSDNAEVYRTNTSFVSYVDLVIERARILTDNHSLLVKVFSDENTKAVLTLLDPQPGEVILDVGCGSGEITAKIHSIVSQPGPNGKTGKVIGVDKSEDMIKAASKGNSSETLEYFFCDGHELQPWLVKTGKQGTFDKVFSNAALHWMSRDPAAVVHGMFDALKPGGTMAVEFGGHMNAIGVVSGLHSILAKKGVDAKSVHPWYFPTPKQYSIILQNAGFQSPDTAYLFPRPTPLPKGSGIKGWLKTFSGHFLNALPTEQDRIDALQELEDMLKVDMYDEQEDEWTLMYVRLRIRAKKP
ncbi:S-adenosyl-L-methionine-dependent methyltransferase [Meira miltonrushii]|uniref:S-adenosyl-L-methionine-dependent methyltransferase n=1 Tax=Meira miltonrushii TaxID=1280837 RepID=A0A316VB60_9BASI|nr:S-adenosyl-L-methionine-dependent methyltransferase [Meira miltonrushii]PWN32795.1 S-adenosyl-L-methionine-dependent methyltransferase [Meira miltonrushii]